MAKQLNYTHPNGTEYLESYWRITSLLVDVPKRYARFNFSGYKDQNARLNSKDPIGSKTVIIRDDIFDLYFQQVTLKEKNPQEVGYEYCVLYKDTPIQVLIENEDGTFTETTETCSFFKDSLDC